ncbi:MAG: thioredoxin domain-containing protein [Gammaproteobacteria bacterium]|nr:thioredoxin domain-containing protein [Gammaproteobacteria bacterium]
MAILPYVVDGTAENFPRVVLENSRRGPVLVHFWSPQAGPCMVLMPRLVRVLGDYGGRVFGVMINVDAHPRLARELGIRALPMIQMFRDGAVVGRLQGVETESALRDFLGRYAHAPDGADQAYVRGDVGRAAALAAQAALDHPEDPFSALRVAKLLVLDGRPEEALALLEAIPQPVRPGEMVNLHAHLSLIVRALHAKPDAIARALAETPEADTLFAAAGLALQQDDYAAAARYLDRLLATDPAFCGGLGVHAVEAVAALPHMPERERAQLREALARAQSV